MHNASLILFTLLIQTAVGIFGTTLLNIRVAAWGVEPIPLNILSVCLGLVVLGLISAMAHLGNPKNAPHAIMNIHHSWLSREIVTIHLFGASMALLWVMTVKQVQEGVFILETAAFVLSLFTVLTMSRVYRLRTVPAWNTIATPLDFWGTVFLLGGVSAAALNGSVSDLIQAPHLFLVSLSCVGLVLKMLALFLAAAVQKRSKNVFWYASSRDKHRGQTLGSILKALLYTTGLALFAAAGMGMTRQSFFLIIIAFAILLVTEIWNRFSFYDSFCRLGL